MADTKISSMTALTGAGVATSDIMPIIDVSATTAGSKSITMAELYNYLATILQPLDSDLTSIAALTTTSYGRAFLALADAAAARTAIGTVIGTDVQAYDGDLATIAGLTATTDNFIQSKSSAWASRTPTQVTADLIAMVGDSGSGGTKGLVPAPAAGDAAASKFLKADGTWATAGGSITPLVLTDANTVDQYNSTTAQTHRIYNTRTDASNGEWLEVSFSSNVPTISATKNGTGTYRDLRLAAGGSTVLTVKADGNTTIANGLTIGNNVSQSSGSYTLAGGGLWFSGYAANLLATGGVVKFSSDGGTGGAGIAVYSAAKTIATGSISSGASYLIVDTEAAAATDDLDTITGGVNGMFCVVSAANSSRDVVLKDGTGNLQLAGDCTLDNIQDTITLIYNSTQSAWLELCRSNNGA